MKGENKDTSDKITLKKVFVSIAWGIAFTVGCWLYLNSYYTLNLEDGLMGKVIFFRNKLLKVQPKKNRQFVFINTGKDLNLVDDTSGMGNITVSDRYKIFKLLQAINLAKVKPKFVLLDLQFYYPYRYSLNDSVQQVVQKSGLIEYFPSPAIDDSLQLEISKNRNLAITALLNEGKMDTPLYKAVYGLADYTTFGLAFNKFKLNYNAINAVSIPILLHEKLDGVAYKGESYATFANNRLCFNYIWPAYYAIDEPANNPSYQYYSIGALTSLKNPQFIADLVKDKVVFIGNFEGDLHDTPNGPMYGTVVLADIYLTLLNGHHYVPYLWIVFMLVSFSVLSYVAFYHHLPMLKFKFRFIFGDQIASFIKDYISYFTILSLLSIVSILLFNITMSLFLPAFIFSIIDFFVNKKYKPTEQL